MKKKTVTMLLALTLAASFCLTGCGDNGTPVQTTESSETVSDETAEAGDTAEKGEAADTENEADTDKKAAVRKDSDICLWCLKLIDDSSSKNYQLLS